MSFSLLARIKSFKHAFRGIWIMFNSQHNAWIHLLAIVVVISLGIYTDIDRDEWIFLTLSIGLVLVAELANTAIEYLGDAVSSEADENIRNAKDIGAGTVLLAALIAVIVACIIFVPKIVHLLASST